MKSFNLSEVKLTESEFLSRRELVRKYLHEFDVDRVVVNFRLNAGIETDAEPLGGWVSPGAGVAGHFTGHWLSACAKFYYSDNDEVLKNNALRAIDILSECQKENGYLSAFREEMLDTLERDEDRNISVPYYTIGKIMQGLCDCASLIGSDKALDMALRLARYIKNRFDRLSEEKIDAILHCGKVNPLNEHGNMGDSLYSLYDIAGEKWILGLAEVFDRDYFIGRLSENEDVLTDLHANTHLPQVIASIHRYNITGDEKYFNAARNFLEFLNDRTFVNGSNSSKANNYIKGGVSEKSEHWGCRCQLGDALTGGESESCCGHNTERILEKMYCITEDIDYLSQLVRLKYNSVLNCASSESGLSIYHQKMGMNVRKEFSTKYDSFWCCTASGVEALSEINRNIYFHDDNRLVIAEFIPSVLKWDGITVRQKTGYLYTDLSELIFDMDNEKELELLFRAERIESISVNGIPTDIISEKGYAKLKRVFRNGDVITVNIRSELRTERLIGTENTIALLYGDIVLCAKDKAPSTVGITEKNITDHITGNDIEGLEFILTDDKGDRSVFVPMFSIENEEYTCYFEVNQ